MRFFKESFRFSVIYHRYPKCCRCQRKYWIISAQRTMESCRMLAHLRTLLKIRTFNSSIKTVYTDSYFSHKWYTLQECLSLSYSVKYGEDMKKTVRDNCTSFVNTASKMKKVFFHMLCICKCVCLCKNN